MGDAMAWASSRPLRLILFCGWMNKLEINFLLCVFFFSSIFRIKLFEWRIGKQKKQNYAISFMLIETPFILFWALAELRVCYHSVWSIVCLIFIFWCVNTLWYSFAYRFPHPLSVDHISFTSNETTSMCGFRFNWQSAQKLPRNSFDRWRIFFSFWQFPIETTVYQSICSMCFKQMFKAHIKWTINENGRTNEFPNKIDDDENSTEMTFSNIFITIQSAKMYIFHWITCMWMGDSNSGGINGIFRDIQKPSIRFKLFAIHEKWHLPVCQLYIKQRMRLITMSFVCIAHIFWMIVCFANATTHSLAWNFMHIDNLTRQKSMLT